MSTTAAIANVSARHAGSEATRIFHEDLLRHR
jgi:hypothetical protein